MQIFNPFKKYILLSTIIIYSISFDACKKKDNVNTYEVNEVEILPVNINKTHLKTNEQYVSILYANLFQKALSANQVYDISKCFQSIGDQTLVREVLISNFMNKPGVIMPTVSQMNNNLDQFIIDTYKRFYVRTPTEAEKQFLNKMITTDPNITPELVYFSFALSDEYMYY